MSSTPESEWDDEQQGWMLALALYRAGQCPHCGRGLDECTDRKAQRGWTVSVQRCHATTALLAAQESSNRSTPEALLWRVERR